MVALSGYDDVCLAVDAHSGTVHLTASIICLADNLTVLRLRKDGTMIQFLIKPVKVRVSTLKHIYIVAFQYRLW